jgi:two-component system CheB/CheR fusion protein
MVREGLLFDLRAALQRAKREGAPARRENVRARIDGKVVSVSLEVVPFSTRQTRGRLYLVLFDAASGADRTRRPKPPPRAPGRKTRGPRSATAEQELAATKDYLQTIIEQQEATNEELMSANEEILSSNEELQSTNEELETAKEELQSSNEELSTVNDELNNRNTELHDVNNDLAMLLGSVHVPMVILDAELRVRRATPTGARMLNLVAADVGRRLIDLRPNVDVSEVERLVREVMDTVSPRDADVQDSHGRWHSMRLRPYKTSDRRIDGVVITWVDVDGERQGPRKAVRTVGAAMLALLDRPAAMLGTDLRVLSFNDAWRRLFAPRDEEPESWGDAKLLADLRDLVAGGPPIERRPVRVPGPGGVRTLEVSAHVARPEPADAVVLLRVTAVA